MELKELAKKVLDIFGAETPDHLPKRIKETLFGFKSQEVMTEYMQLFPDLKQDWLQRIYQFWSADREEKKQDYTPVSLAELLAYVGGINSGRNFVYDGCSGSGSLTIRAWSTNKELSFLCDEIDENVLPILLFNLSIRNIHAVVRRRDIINNITYETFRLTPGEKFSRIEPLFFEEDMKCDVCISNPPFNQKFDKSMTEAYSDWLMPGGDGNCLFIMRALEKAERAVFILPSGFLNGSKYEDFRKECIKRGILRCAISLPDNMFESTGVATCILFLDKKWDKQEVILVDATSMCSKEVREQRGEGDTHYQRVYKRTFNVFSANQIMAVVEASNRPVNKISKVINLQEAEDKRYSLVMGTYIEPEIDGNIIRRDFNEILKDINRVIRHRNVLKFTVNKVWAHDLGLDVLAQLNAESNKLSESINESLGKLGIQEKINTSRYIVLSNSKELKVENTDKEILSETLILVMDMYRQHIYYLNTEENRLLMELRDALLPELMSGRLSFNEEVEP